MRFLICYRNKRRISILLIFILLTFLFVSSNDKTLKQEKNLGKKHVNHKSISDSIFNRDYDHSYNEKNYLVRLSKKKLDQLFNILKIKVKKYSNFSCRLMF